MYRSETLQYQRQQKKIKIRALYRFCDAGIDLHFY